MRPLEISPKPKRCKNCKKLKGDHRAKTLECPKGPRTRIGYLDYLKGTKYKD